MRLPVCVLSFICGAAMAAAQTGAGRHVIVVSLDGFSAYALRDAAIPLPVLRRLMAEGGFADGLVPVNPTVTWPNHTTMVSGVGPAGHGVLYNGLPVRDGEGRPVRIEQWVDKKELVQARTVYDAAHEAGLTVAEVDWVAIYHAGSVDWPFAEIPSEEGTVEREMVAGGLATAEQIRGFSKQPITLRDELWMRAAVHIIEKHKPNLMLLHLLATDTVQHQYGARSLGTAAALILADRQLQRVLDAVERAGIRDRTTLLVVSDHGFKSYQHVVRPNALLREKGLLADRQGQVECDAWALSEGGTAMVYVTREAKREATLRALHDAFRGVAGIAAVIASPEYARYGYPAPTQGGRMADMVLVAAPGYAFDGSAAGEAVSDVAAGATPGNHGYLNADLDMTAILVAWGAGIRPGSHLGAVPNVNVAPTIARLLGLPFPGTEGTALQDLLR
jgi:hypothetical protein